MGQLDGTSVRDEAVSLAAQIWCEPQWEHLEMDVDFAESIAAVIEGVLQQRENWIDTAHLNQQNANYWQAELKARR